MSTYVLGLTGQTGAGKSTVREILAQRNLPVIDADTVAKEVINDSKQCLADLAIEFSVSILNDNGSLNREKLADIVFSDKSKLRRLNIITFPYIREKIKELLIEQARKAVPLIIIDAPTLFESGCDKLCSGILSITAPEKDRLNRIILRDRISDKQARQRIVSQNVEEFYTSRSNYVIINNKDIDELKFNTFKVLEMVEKSL
ncbi:MAG: dephospho-CoA kinase [Oscillospiraceae bacterium]